MEPVAVEVLTPAECRVLRDKIHAARPHWSNKGGGAPFFTLGVSAYLEAQYGGAIAYTLAAKRQRPGLTEAFGDVYERVRVALEGALGETVQYHTRLALPGFHIFLANPAFENPVCSVHIDQPYKNLDWRAYEEVDPTRTISFTMAVSIPRSGAGLNMWPGVDLAASPDKSARELTAGIEPVFHPYAPGRMVIHHGHTVHQIAPFKVLDEGDERITLQGHAIYSPHGWLAYF